MAQARNWVFTIQKPTGLLDFDHWTCKDVSYAIYSEEVGQTGNYHFQGYIQMIRSTRRNKMLELCNGDFQGAHLEPQRATNSDDAKSYCAKVDDPTFISGPYEYGTYRHMGARMDLLKVKSDIDDGHTAEQIWEDHFGACVRYHKSFTVYTQMRAPKRDHIDSVIVVYGDTGLGKTHWATETFPGFYRAVPPNNTSIYLEKYQGESTIIVDEFNGWWPLHWCLCLCDKYPFRLPYRGGETECLATNIVFTTNKKPWTWWHASKGSLDLHPQWPAFARRVTLWIHFTAYMECYATPSFDCFNRHVMGHTDNNNVQYIE